MSKLSTIYGNSWIVARNQNATGCGARNQNATAPAWVATWVVTAMAHKKKKPQTCAGSRLLKRRRWDSNPRMTDLQSV